MLKKNIFAAVFAVACAMISAQASAQSYLGGTVGRTKWSVDCTGTNPCSTGAAGFKLYGGYEFNQTFALEGGYVYLNEVSFNISNLKATFNGRGFDLAGVFKTPEMNRFRGFGKVGAAFMKGELIASVGGAQGSDNNYSTQPLVGFGVLYSVDKNLSLRAEFDHRRVKASGYPDTTSNVNMFSVGLQSSF
ncbi:outer membrane beta-barrel protein [Undibacterium cyanobacteriorum]|uniref:Outer membrane beta-barrel protein n=1 Tax=Undibacterium cyanobacteriorum TaxID=3073561 RepID=A0ABY9RHK0_9BURK|nr:outer membrane beta-barrel protein [Undibacterium sp. 20NA77.5]WMW80139.1 outer membrane beta-barrel protein [Undibacterium sp. 20NA77.5]